MAAVKGVMRVQERACIGGFMVDLDGVRRGGYGTCGVNREANGCYPFAVMSGGHTLLL